MEQPCIKPRVDVTLMMYCPFSTNITYLNLSEEKIKAFFHIINVENPYHTIMFLMQSAKVAFDQCFDKSVSTLFDNTWIRFLVTDTFSL